jgi:hypothetical protein
LDFHTGLANLVGQRIIGIKALWSERPGLDTVVDFRCQAHESQSFCEQVTGEIGGDDRHIDIAPLCGSATGVRTIQVGPVYSLPQPYGSKKALNAPGYVICDLSHEYTSLMTVICSPLYAVVHCRRKLLFRSGYLASILKAVIVIKASFCFSSNSNPTALLSLI